MEMERVRGRDFGQKDRRKFSRVRDDIFIFCKMEKDYRTYECIAKDISEKGLKFESDEFIPVSTPLEIEIYQPLDCLKSRIVSIYVIGKLVWSKGIEKGAKWKNANRYIGGVKFVKISKNDRDIIVNYVKEKSKEL